MAKKKIKIKPENKGKFTAYKKRTGKTTEEALHSKDPHVRQMANFARNAKKWKHEDGGLLYMDGESGANVVFGNNWNYSTVNPSIIGKTTPTIPENLQPYNINIAKYQHDDRELYTPTAPTGMEGKTEVKDLKPFGKKDTFNPKFNITPYMGNKYLQRGVQYLNQGINHFANMGNPNYEKPLNYYNGINSTMFAADGLQVPIEMNRMEQTSISSLNPNNLSFDNGDNTLYSPTNNTGITQNTEQNNSGGAGFNQNKFNSIMQGVAGAVNTVQSGINFGKGALDIIGSKNQNKQEELRNAQQYAQSVYSQALDY